MVMTIKDHADIESEGTRSPCQERRAAIDWRISEATKRRDREDKRLMRLTRLQNISDARHRAALEDIAEAMADLRSMRT